MYISASFREKWNQSDKLSRRQTLMVKGTTRQVVVIKSPDPRIFDEAIFIVREEAAHRGVSSREVLAEAQTVANRYIAAHRVPKAGKLKGLPPHVCALLGAGFTGVLWALTAFLF